jgi:hypothetical protein
MGSNLQARVAIDEERARYQEALKDAEASDEILFVYLIDLDGA